MCCVTPAGSTIPEPTIFATAVDMKAPATLRIPAPITATNGLITRVDTTVAMALALSCHPFEKSNSNASTTTRNSIPVSSGIKCPQCERDEGQWKRNREKGTYSYLPDSNRGHHQLTFLPITGIQDVQNDRSARPQRARRRGVLFLVR